MAIFPGRIIDQTKPFLVDQMEKINAVHIRQCRYSIPELATWSDSEHPARLGVEIFECTVNNF
jgi:hypothetical protein